MTAIPLPVLFAVLVVAFLAFIGVLVFTGQKSRKKERVLNLIANRSAEATDKQDKNGKTPAKSDPRSIAKKLKAAEGRAEAHKNRKSLTSLIAQAGYETSLLKFWVYSLLFGSICTSMILMAGLSPLVKGLLIFTVYLGLPRFYLRWRRQSPPEHFPARLCECVGGHDPPAQGRYADQ